MQSIIILFAVIMFFVLLFNSVIFRLILLHPIATPINMVKDIYHYYIYNYRYKYDGGVLNCYFAHFGGGKTLSVTKYVCQLYKRYNNRRIWDRSCKKYVLQKVHIISNVHLNGTPYEELVSLSQVVCCAWKNKKIDEENNTRTVVLVLLDEASSQMNSRNFKTNIDADFLNTLITSRHFNMSMFYTSQKFKLVDALLRSVTQRCIWCHKVWRFMVTYYYDADEMEYATNPTLVKPIRRTGFFVKDKHYNAYDTLATVEHLKKAVDANDMMSEKEILELRGQINPDLDGITPSRKFIRKRKKMK